MNGIRLNGRTAVVTGASRLRGIGAAVCRALAAEGADILFTHWTPYDRTMPWASAEGPDEPALLAEQLREYGVKAYGFAADLSDPGAAELVMDEAERRLGAPHILVNNACYSVNDDLGTITAASLDAHYAVNVRAVVLLSVCFARRFSGGTGGRIISLTSGQSLGPMAGEISYATTKGAIDAFTVTFAQEAGRKGITVNAVNPGPTDTGWMDEKTRLDLTQRTTFGRTGAPADAARLIQFLATDDGAWMTGQILHSTGGFR